MTQYQLYLIVTVCINWQICARIIFSHNVHEEISVQVNAPYHVRIKGCLIKTTNPTGNINAPMNSQRCRVYSSDQLLRLKPMYSDRIINHQLTDRIKNFGCEVTYRGRRGGRYKERVKDYNHGVHLNMLRPINKAPVVYNNTKFVRIGTVKHQVDTKPSIRI